MIHKQLKNRNKKSRFFVAAAIEAPVKLFLGRRCGSSRDLLRNFAGGGCLRIHFAPAQQQLEPSAALVRGTGPYGLLSEEKISTLVSAFSPSTDTRRARTRDVSEQDALCWRKPLSMGI